MSWVIGFSGITAGTSTQYTLHTDDKFNNVPAEVRIHGTGLTYDANNFINGGTIASMDLWDVSGNPAVLLQTVTFGTSIDGATLFTDYFAAPVSIMTQLATWGVDLNAAGEPAPITGGFRFTLQDNSYVDILGTGLNQEAGGVVNSVTHYDAGGGQLHAMTGLPAAFDALVVAVGGYSRGLYWALTQGDDTVTGSAANLIGLDGGGGNDAITALGVIPGIAEYGGATGPVTVDLSAGTTSGAGSDTLTNINAVAGSNFGDTLIGNSDKNTFFGQLGDDTLTGNGGNDFFAYVPEAADIGNDTITDFKLGEDTIQIQSFGTIDNRADLTFTDIGNDVKVAIAGVTGSILVKNVTASQLDNDSNFFFTPANGGGGGNTPTVAITAFDASKNEGASGTNTFTFKVTRTGDPSGTSSVHWAVSSQNGATADDFVGGQLPSGDVTFTAGQTEQNITVNVNGDTQSEANESFSVTLSNPTGAAIGTGTATGTIIDDDSNTSNHYNDWSGALDLKGTFNITENRVTIANTDGTETVINGSGLDTPTGTISSIERHVPNTTLLVSVTGDLPTFAAIQDAFAEVASIAGQITWQIAGQGGPEFSLDGSWLLLPDGDGTYTKLFGSGLPIEPNSGPTGTIASIVHVAADKSTQVGTDTVTFTPSITIGLFVAAAFGEAGYIADVMFGGNNTIKSNVAQGWHINHQGGPGNDIYSGSAADEGFDVGHGTDTVNGGGGFDIITNWDGQSAMTADLLSKTASGTGWSATVTNIEGVSGTSFGDTLSGDNASNHIQGEGGDDTMTGRGSGDTFFYYGADWDSANFGQDTITDFQAGVDTIMLLQFANVTKMADLTITENGSGHAVISVPGGTGTITLTGVSKNALGESSFAFNNTGGGGGNGAALAIVADKASKNEGNSGNTAFTFFVNRTGSDLSGAASVEWSISLPAGTADAADFAGATSGTVYFTAGETQKQITVNVAGDLVFEGDEMFGVELSNPTGNSYIQTGNAAGDILDDDQGGGSQYFDWREVFQGGAMNSPPAELVSPSKIVMLNQDGTKTVFNGSFVIESGNPKSGPISSVQLTDADGTVRTTISGGVPAVGGFGMAPVDALTDKITWRNTIDQNLQGHDSFSSTRLVFTNLDGTKTVIVGSSLNSVGDPPVLSGTVTSIQHTQANGTTLIGSPVSVASASLKLALAAIFDYQANQYFFENMLAGANTITSNFAADGGGMLFGGAGNDVFTGSAGYDVLDYETATAGVTINLGLTTVQATGGSGSDQIKGSVEGVSGSMFADTIIGNGAKNEIKGRFGNDKLSGLGDEDWLHGNEGDDTLEGGAGADMLLGGEGTDTASYAGSTAGVTVSLDLQGTDTVLDPATAQTSSGDAAGDKLYGIENLTGSAQGDVLTGDGGANRIDGGLGNDIIEGGAGDDVLLGGGGTATTPGNDTVSYAGAAAGVTVSLALATKQNTGGAGSDTLSGFESILGSGFDDKLTGSSGDNTLAGSLGDDVLIGGAGKDALVGGGGKDAASYETATAGVTASLANTKLNTGDAAGDTYDGIGRLIGSNFDDKLTGDAGSNRLIGLGGNDVLEGGGEGDYFDGGAGIDTVSYKASELGVDVSLIDDAFGLGVNGEGGDAQGDHFVWDAGAGRSTIENITGSDESDTLTGDKGNNRLDGGDGSDTIDGGAGDDILIGGLNSNSGDTLTYAKATAGVTVNLSLTTQQDTKGAGKDTVSGFENLIGSDFSDTLTGGLSATVGDEIHGGKGNDVIKGQAGNDRLHGDDGDDVIEGGLGADDLEGGDNGAGGDTVSYAASSGGVSVDLATSTVAATTGDGVGDEISNFENVVGSNQSDTLIGDTGDNVLEGLGGDDKMTGGDGVDTASYAKAAAAVTVSLATIGTKQATGGAGGDTFTDAFENLTGSAFDDKLTGNSSVNTILGGKGNDTIEGGGGADNLDGGEGTSDTVSYAGSAAGVRVELEYFDAGSQSFKNGQDGTFAQTAVGGDSDGDVLTGFENITGSAQGDILYGDAKNNKILGGAGDDRIEGGLGDDILDGGTNTAFGDIVSYERAASGVTVSLATTGQQDTKGAGKDTITNFERLRGSTHADTLTGSDKAEVIKGDKGDDIIQGGAGADELDGGDGIDTVSYQASTAAVFVDLSTNIQALKYGLAANNGDATGDDLSLFENVIGSNLADTLVGDAGDNVIEGLGGDDKLTGGDGIDTVSYQRAAAGVTVNLALSTKQVTGGAGADTLVDLFENLTGSAFNDTLKGNDLDNVIRGGKGNDIIIASFGSDIIDGGDGIDTVSYAEFAADPDTGEGIQIDMHFGGAGISIENLIGSAGNDVLTGNDEANTISGGSGFDIIDGGEGNDILDGGGSAWDVVSYGTAAAGVTVSLTMSTQQDTKGAGKDTIKGFEVLVGSRFDDVLTGGSSHDTIYGDDGNDVIEGGGFGDYLRGEGGYDLISYAHSSNGVKVNLSTNAVSGGDAQGDQIGDFEGVIGSNSSDTLTGDGNANTLSGLAGNDTLIGGDGADLLIGGAGFDVLTGGLGADVFEFAKIADMGGTSPTFERITDFTSGEDILQFLASGFAGTTKGGAVNFLAAAGVGAPSAPDSSKSWFLYDTDDGKLYFDGAGAAATRTLLLTLDGHPSLVAGDIKIV